ncbi:hypothetical protein BGX29_007751 [Mortierella sp. GBA35]|nr:hypothetical protein BGX29_007751 [Mortierella sp. GBA35]
MPAEHTTTTTTVHRTTTATQAIGSARPSSNRTTTTTRASRSITATILISTTKTLTPTPTITPVPEAGGMSGAAIGGMAAGGAAIVAIIGLLCYKRRKRGAVGDSSAAAATKGGKTGVSDAELAGVYSGASKAISGPTNLTPEKGNDSAPAHRPEAQFREQQQFRPGMRDELFAQPGSALHGTMSKSPKSPTTPNGAGSPPRPPPPVARQNSDHGNQQGNQQGNQGNMESRPPLHKQNSSDGYYDEVNDYYGDDSMSVVPDTMGAQRSAPQPRNLAQGNLTPTPASHIAPAPTASKDDVGRGMDSPGGKNVGKNGPPGPGRDSPRSSYSSDGESTYLTLEQAQQAHNHKMMGHKESISSVEQLLDRSSPGAQQQYQGHNQNYQQPYQSNNLAPPRGPGTAPPMSPDPYAESAFNDYADDRSMVSSPYRPPPPNGSPYGSPYQQPSGHGQSNNSHNNNNNQRPYQGETDYNQGPYGRF